MTWGIERLRKIADGFAMDGFKFKFASCGAPQWRQAAVQRGPCLVSCLFAVIIESTHIIIHASTSIIDIRISLLIIKNIDKFV